jgi:hypothetical protein
MLHSRIGCREEVDSTLGQSGVATLETFHWPPSYDLPSLLFFLFSLKARIWIIFFSFSDMISDLNL